MTHAFTLENHGSLVLISPTTDDARDQLRNLVGADAPWWGLAVVCEPRYVADLIAAIQRGA
jgi:hypothetical protein